LISAIIYEEQTHQLPFEGALEHFGFGKTVGLGQITVSGQTKYSRSELLDLNFSKNIDSIAIHLNNVQSSTNGLTATRYNYGPATSVSKYGRRVDRYQNNFETGSW
jgi:hypothetical protein